MIQLLRTVILLPLILAMPISAVAQSAIDEKHPAVATAVAYVRDVSTKNWESAAEKLKARHLDLQRVKYSRAIRSTPSIDAEVRMLQRLGVERVREVEAMSGRDFYIRHQRAIDNERKLTPSTHKRMTETFKATFLGAIQEGDGLVHVVMRTSHNTLNATVSELLIVSMEKDGSNWLVAPEHQELQIKPLITGDLPEEMKKEAP